MRTFTKKQEEAAAWFQELLVRNGASILWPDDTLIDSDSDRNVFNYADR